MSELESPHKKGSSITRVLEIIEAVAKAEHPLSPSDLSFMLNIPKPSLHRLLQQLQEDNYLQINMRGLVVPSDRLFAMALGVIYSSRYKAVRQQILRRVAEQTGETCGIAIADGLEMVYYDRVQTNWPLQIYLPVGSRVPVWATSSGKLYLSSFSKPRLKRLLNNTLLERTARNTITDVDSLADALTKIAKTGLSVDNEEFIDGMVAVSVAITDKTGKLAACLYIHAPSIRRSLEELCSFEPILRKAAKELSELISEES